MRVGGTAFFFKPMYEWTGKWAHKWMDGWVDELPWAWVPSRLNEFEVKNGRDPLDESDTTNHERCGARAALMCTAGNSGA